MDEYADGDAGRSYAGPGKIAFMAMLLGCLVLTASVIFLALAAGAGYGRDHGRPCTTSSQIEPR